MYHMHSIGLFSASIAREITKVMADMRHDSKIDDESRVEGSLCRSQHISLT